MSEFDDFFRKKKREAAAQAATNVLISPDDPDQLAQDRAIASQLKIPTGVVSQSPGMFENQIKQKQDTESLLDADKIRGWLQDPENAALAKDDVEALTGMERIFKSFQQGDAEGIVRSQRFARDAGASLETSALGRMLDRGSETFDGTFLTNADGEPNVLGRIANSFRSSAADTDGVPRSFVGGDRVTLEQRFNALKNKPLNAIGRDAERRSEQFKAEGFAPRSYKDVSGIGSAFMFIAENLSASAADMAVVMASGGFAPVLQYSLSAGEVNQELSEKTDLSHDQRIAVASGTGVVMAGLEMFGLAKVLGDLLPGQLATNALDGVLADKLVKNGLSVAAAKTLQAGIAEGSTELIQEGLVVGVTSLSGGQYKEGEVIDRLTNSFLTGGAIGVGLRGGVEIPTAAGKQFVRLAGKAMRSGGSREKLAQLDSVVEASNLKRRAPDKLLDALEAAGSADLNLYVPAQDVLEYFQSQNLSDAEVERWGVSPETFAEKVASGGDIIIPAADYAANIAGTDDADWLRVNAVFDPDEMSPAQVQRFNEEAAEAFQQAHDEMLERQRLEQEGQSSDAQIHDGIYSQLRAAGRSVDVARSEARVWQSFWNTMAERYGDDPLEMARRFGVRIQGPNREIVAGRRRGEFDIMLNTLRRSDNKASGRSLIDFLVSRGGLQDFGGDISALDPPKGLVSATRSDREKQQLNLDGTPVPIPGEGLDVAGRAAVDAGYFPELLATIADNNLGQEADLVQPLLDAIGEELAGNPRYLDGEGPDADLEALAEELDRAGIDLAQTNDAIVEALEQVASDGGQYFQNGDTQRGSILFPQGGLAEGETVINLFERADLSTFLHESGHFFLEAFTELASQDGAPADMKSDLASIREFLGVEDGQSLETGHHEKWARAFEGYALEGRAPSLALADAFSRFKSWLMRIYRSARDLDAKLTPQIRDVMDRMLATESEIAEARESASMRPLFSEKAPDGMADGDYKTYQRMARRSVEQADQRLLKKTMAKVKREREAWYKTERSSIRLGVEGEINSQREHRLVEMLANQQWLGSDREVPDMQIDRAQLVEMMGEGVLPELSRKRLGGKRGIYGKDGEAPQAVSDFFGFQSVTEMVEILQNMPKRIDAIELETDRRMTERYGDPLNDGSIEEEALLAIHSDQQAATVIAEVKHLNRRVGRRTVNNTAKVYKARARQLINDMPVRDIMRPDVFLNAERKAAREAEKAFAQVARQGGAAEKALNTAAAAKERQLLNHYLYREARDADAWVRKGREKARSYDAKKTREKIGAGFIEQIDGILDRFDFRVRSNKQIERSESLRDFVRRMTDEGREAELAISDKLLDESRRMHFTRLPVGELRGVFDTLDNLDHMGRMKGKLIEKKRRRDLNNTVDAFIENFENNVKKKEPARTKSKGEQRRKDARDYLNLTLNADTLLREIDGFEDLGTAYSTIKQPIDEGMARLTERRLKMAEDLDEIYNAYDAATLRDMSKKRSVSALGGEFTQWEIISIALNTGNADNYQRLTNPKTEKGFTEDQVSAALQELSEQDWRTVQSLWDYIGSFWPEIADKEKRTTSVVPKKVESKLMVAAPDFVKGGYYPIKYDYRLSGRATEQDQQSLSESLMGGRFGKAQTANGHTKERATNVTMPLELDLSVAHSHLSQVLYDLEIGEAVTNAWRIMRDDRIKAAFLNNGKRSDLEALEIWLQDVAAGDRYTARGMEKVWRHLRSGFTISRLAVNISTALIQPSGLAQSAVVVGKRAMAAGVVDFAKHPGRWTGEALAASSFMRERQTTFERDIFNVVGDLEDGPVTGKWSKFQRDIVLPFSFLLMQKVQFYVVDMPTWVGAYNKELKNSGDNERALLYADRMVARSQGSGLMSDRGMLERGTTDRNSRQRELPRMLTALGSYMFAKGNVAYEATMKTNFKDPVEVMKWAVDIALLFTFEAVLYSAVKGFGPDEDEDLAVWLLKETGFSMMSTVPGLREVSGGLQGFGSGGILGSTIDKAFVRPVTQISQGDFDKALAKSLVDMAGIWFHLPSSQTNTILNAVLDDDMGVKRDIDPLAVVGVGTGRGNSLADYFMTGDEE